MGKTSTRGHKGQWSRTGARLIRGFEGGQMPLHRRIPSAASPTFSARNTTS